MCHPRNFRCETFDMGLLSLENVFRYEQGKGAIPDSNFLDIEVEPVANLVPDEPCRWLGDVSRHELRGTVFLQTLRM